MTSGSVYLLPRATFTRTDTRTVHFDEWASPQTVRPLARPAVAPEDFSFLHQVAEHDNREIMPVSWLRYKARIRRGYSAARG